MLSLAEPYVHSGVLTGTKQDGKKKSKKLFLL